MNIRFAVGIGGALDIIAGEFKRAAALHSGLCPGMVFAWPVASAPGAPR